MPVPEIDGLRCSSGCVRGIGHCQAGVCTGRFRPAGSRCRADQNPCTIDRCDGAGICQPGPCSACCDASGGACVPAFDASCQHPSEPQASVALVKRRHRLRWTWARGDVADFGDATSLGATICAYQGDSHDLLVAAEAPAGTCGKAACWSASPKRQRYHDPRGALGGIRSLVLRSGTGSRASIRASARDLTDFLWKGAEPPLATPVRVQVKVDGQCWESTFSAPDTSNAKRFVARGGSPSRAFLRRPALLLD